MRRHKNSVLFFSLSLLPGPAPCWNQTIKFKAMIQLRLFIPVIPFSHEEAALSLNIALLADFLFYCTCTDPLTTIPRLIQRTITVIVHNCVHCVQSREITQRKIQGPCTLIQYFLLGCIFTYFISLIHSRMWMISSRVLWIRSLDQTTRRQMKQC